MKQVYLVIVLLLSLFEVHGQFEFDTCPSDITCIDGILYYEGDFGPDNDPTPIQPEVTMCNGHVTIGFAAIRIQATSSYLYFEAHGNTHDDYFIRGGIKEACEGEECIAFSNPGNIYFELETNELIPGNEYIIYVSQTGVTDFYVTIEEGVNEIDLSIESIDVKYEDQCNYPSNGKYCCSSELFVELESEIEDIQELEGLWTLEMDGPVNETLYADDLYSFNFCDLPDGEYEMTLVSYEGPCYVSLFNVSTTIELESIVEEFGDFSVCTHDLESGSWIPDNWEGEPITEPGYIESITENDCGCAFFQSATFVELEERIGEVTLELCPEDFPYELFDDFELEYNPSDYEAFFIVEEESLLRDSDRNYCDSMFWLTVIVENPEEQCVTCDLPLILEDSKLVYCIPFDNGSFDVSGNANTVDPQGVEYDNNGPVSNPLWEAVLDGRDDYIRLPYFEDLNTSGFAFDLHFNKDDDYDNGDIETLISKGDEADDHLRYSVELHKKTEEQFDLVAKFYTETTEHELTIPDMFINTWYGTSFVIEEDSISMYLNGELYAQQFKSGALKGNSEDVYLGIKQVDQELEQAYGGRMDNFKYWKEKLSAQDILYLYYPEKQFEVNVDLFMTCCEGIDYEGILINAQNPTDTIVIPEASPTGYDSVFYINYVEIESGPQLVNGMQLEDIIVMQTVSCNETCGAEVSWQLPDAQSFSDLCGISGITSSFGSSLQLDENVSYLEVDYVASNNCGHSSAYSFAVELICEYESFTPLAEEYGFEIENTLDCDNAEVYCLSNTYNLHPFALDQGLTEEIEVLDYDNLELTWMLNGEAQTRMIESQSDLNIELAFEEAGFYDICLLSMESACDSKALDYCRTIEVVNGSSIDYGKLKACEGSIASVLPDEMDTGLQQAVIESNAAGSYKISYADDCGCVNEERVEIELIENEIAVLELDVCEASFPIEIMGALIENDQDYDESLLIFSDASEQTDVNGESCDSLILLTINVSEEVEVELSVELCEGDDYMGYTESGTYEIAGLTEEGCDSTTILKLQVKEVVEVFESVSICEGEHYNGYNSTGSYEDVYETASGCDSIVQTELIVNETISLEFNEEICEGEAFVGYEETGIYEEVYMAQNGCDSLVTVNLTVLEESHPDCITSSTEEVLAGVKVYPNPVRDELMINSGTYDKLDMRIYDSSGRMILSGQSMTNSKVDLSEVSSGLLIVMLRDNENGQTQVFKILKLD